MFTTTKLKPYGYERLPLINITGVKYYRYKMIQLILYSFDFRILIIR